MQLNFFRVNVANPTLCRAQPRQPLAVHNGIGNIAEKINLGWGLAENQAARFKKKQRQRSRSEFFFGALYAVKIFGGRVGCVFFFKFFKIPFLIDWGCRGFSTPYAGGAGDQFPRNSYCVYKKSQAFSLLILARGFILLIPLRVGGWVIFLRVPAQALAAAFGGAGARKKIQAVKKFRGCNFLAAPSRRFQGKEKKVKLKNKFWD